MVLDTFQNQASSTIVSICIPFILPDWVDVRLRVSGNYGVKLSPITRSAPSRGSHSDLDWSGTLTAYLSLAGHRIASPNVLIMVQLERSSFNHYRARALFQRVPRISLLWTLIAQKLSTILVGLRRASQHQPAHRSREGTVGQCLLLKHEL